MHKLLGKSICGGRLMQACIYLFVICVHSMSSSLCDAQAPIVPELDVMEAESLQTVVRERWVLCLLFLFSSVFLRVQSFPCSSQLSCFFTRSSAVSCCSDTDLMMVLLMTMKLHCMKMVPPSAHLQVGNGSHCLACSSLRTGPRVSQAQAPRW